VLLIIEYQINSGNMIIDVLCMLYQ